MFKIGGHNLLAILAGAVGHYLVGMLFYGFAFAQLWRQQFLVAHGAATPEAARQLTGAALADAVAAVPGQMPMATAFGVGFLVSLIVAAGLASLQAIARPASLASALRLGFLAWSAFTATTLAYNVIYSAEPITVFWIDLGHTGLAVLAASAVIYSLSRKAAVPTMAAV
jgi:hypothetical protein